MKKNGLHESGPFSVCHVFGVCNQNFFHTVPFGAESVFEFGNHTGIDYSFLLVLLKKCRIKFRKQKKR
jgi:hypothetical protein